ncbi:MAG: ABC transporter permease [Tannerellaceae bacterium]|jgi:ABC-type multidrug transport system permease subunit|nr:ABC transporter permease [Tannerellaceae bacterium]
MKSRFRTGQLIELIRMVWLETIREPETLFWGIVFPVLISIGLGLAFTQKTEEKFQVLIISERTTALDSILNERGVKGEYKKKPAVIWKINDDVLGNTEFNFVRSDLRSAIVSLKRGEADIMISDSIGTLRYHFDPHNSQAQLVYMKLSAMLQHPASPSPDAISTVQPITLKGVRYIDFLIPGLIAFGMMGSMMWGVSYAIIERRSQKLLRRMVATPMKKSNYLISLMTVRTFMNFAEALILIFFAYIIFGISIQGNIAALVTLYLSGNLAFAGIAILISSRTPKTEVGTGLINAVQMPMMILSGIFFSYHNFPEWSLGFIRLLPLTAMADGIRSIFNEGAGWMEILTPTVALSSFGILCFIVGMKRFKWY